MIPEIDLVVLSRDETPLAGDVRRGIAAQTSVHLKVHRVFGPPRPGDATRWETIARARNAGKRQGSADWLFFLDDDVILAPGCVRALWEAMQARAAFGALAADYQGEYQLGTPTLHVAMGATLFRRDALRLVTFRWQPGRCECLCCCDDLRRHGYAIDYLPESKALHARSVAPHSSQECHRSHPCVNTGATPQGFVLAAFDRFHFDRFRQQFLTSLRENGNDEPVVAVTYGLAPTDQRRLAALPGVRPIFLPRNQAEVPIRRLRDFQFALDALPPGAMAAYWDVGDVIFQGRLEELWREAAAYPDQLIVAQEPMLFRDNPAMRSWTLSITSFAERHRAWRLLDNRPVLNSGFASGSVSALRDYFVTAHRMRHSATLRGSTDWGDQMAMNLYCYDNSTRHRLTSDGWNYCLAGRGPREVRVTSEGRIESSHGTVIRAIHGNGGSLRSLTGAWRVSRKLAGAPA